ncbi:low-density lipoprotein receptor-related protein 2a [Garra rufa]|uniref:low-density lipoprotein receptor-related protein 2a n=1 Tax=Garra rufa TaxID=137080 RepID=UPI003CCEA5EC
MCTPFFISPGQVSKSHFTASQSQELHLAGFMRGWTHQPGPCVTMHLQLLLIITLCVLHCDCQGSGCEAGSFHCGTGRCIPASQRCDGTTDCSDNSDEIGCPQPTCESAQFQCLSDGECIPQHWVCDDEEDCEDGSDERQHCPGRTCSSSQFTCTNGACIPGGYRCDRVPDCLDGADERNCLYPECSELRCANGACYNRSQRCDQVLNCRDGSDEANCTQRCSSGQFQCNNGECIPRGYVCDHDDDCGDRSDEQNCTYPTCRGTYFTCPSGRCIHQVWLCDGEDDCEDNADERGCDNVQRECYPGEWPCPSSGVCIPLDHLCDGTAHCPDGEDETNTTAGRNCSIWRCASLSCEHHCHASPDGGTCACPPGYIVSRNDSRSCIDYDDCSLWGMCDQLCEDRIGSHRCSCRDGYLLEQHRYCRANPSSGVPSLIFSNGRDLLIADVHGHNAHTLVESQNRGVAVGVDFHYQLQRVFWTDTIQNKVFSVDMDGSRLQVVLNVSVDYPENLAVDWVNNKLYVVEGSVNRIDMVDLDGSNRVTLIAEHLGNPRGLALDPTVGYLFFSDWDTLNGEPGLERAYMDGTNRYGIIRTKLGWPAGITLDLEAKRVYWVDSRYDYIETTTYDGLHRKTVVHGGSVIPHPFGITLFEHSVYYTDWTKMAVMKANKYTDNSPQELYRTSQRPHGLTVVHAYRQPFVSNPCGANRGGCEHICVLSHRTDNGGLGYRCRCRMGYDLHADGKRCVAVRQFLLFSSQLAVRGIPFNLSTQEDIILPITGSPSYFVGVDFSAADNSIFFSDTMKDIIYKQKVDGTGREVLAANRVDGVEDLAYDWVSKNLYWTDPRYRSISVMKVADKSRRAIVRNLNNPRSIVVHPVAGYIFWTDWYRPAKIMRAWGDGSHSQSIVNTTLGWPNGLAIDWSAMRLYWVDAFFDKIEHSNFDGQNRLSLDRITQISHPFGLTVFGGYVYFTDWRLGGIVRVRKTDGGEMMIIRRGISHIMHVKSFNADSQIGSNFCNRQTNPNGDCSHFCFPAPYSQRVCGCPYGMKLEANQQTCVDDPSNEPPTLQCGSNSFSCTNGKCVPQSYQCDGVDDCHDNSDEANCGANNNTCSPIAFTCANQHCVPRSWHCDGHNDCFDGSDERDCPTQTPGTCQADQFSCANHHCIPRTWLCDTDNDCGDGSDENNCDSTGTCYPGQFQCPDHRCIDPNYVCDGDRDCADGADEQGCVYNCTAYEFKCANGHQCVNSYYRCDGVFDCNDRSDESGCPTRPPGMCHHESEFQCQSDGSCVPSNWECDGHPDCEDGSDEHHACPPRTCPTSQFRCDNGNCVFRGWICDGDNDCRDGSDERDCPTPPFRCPSWQWQCPGHSVCVNLSRVCDNTPDCPNGADESPLCNEPLPDQESCSDNNAGCTHGCIQGPFGAQCTCPVGFQLSNDSKTCEDIDECHPLGICSQHCFNERGSFRCHCQDGYTLEADGRTCKASGSREALLLVASRNQIVSDDILAQPNVIRSLVRDGRNIVAVDFDSVTDRIYWSDTTQDRIWSAHKNGTDRTVIFDSGVTVTESLAVDWVGRNLYWTDYILETVEVAKLDGSHRTVLISENVTNPRGLVVDPRNNTHLMFWTDWGRNPRIERASMDGKLRTTIISNKLYWPNGLTIDYPNNLLYFADAYLDFIDYCDYDGKNRKQVLASDLVLQHPHAITIFEDFVYWTDRYVNRVIRANKWHGQNQTVMLYNLPQPMGLVALHAARQPAGYNPCDPRSNPCTHICLLSAIGPRFYSCACPSGWTLAADQFTCARGMRSKQKIERCSLTGTNREVIVSTAIYPFAMTVYGQHIFWTDWNTRSIYRANKHDGSDQRVMLQNLPSRPMDIHVLSNSKQQQCSSPCEQFNGGCSHICTPGPQGAECQCPSEGRWYLADNKYCIPDNGTRCQSGQFTCMNGRCIRAHWICDNDDDCGDGSDELERVCGSKSQFVFVPQAAAFISLSAFHTCEPTVFTCGNGRCVPYHYRCDHYNDCGDNSDEIGCDFRPCDASTEFTCNNGRCIAREYVCNGINNCYDNGTSDEQNCAERTCQPEHTKCQTTNICIPRSYLCDGDNDCGDNSDESPTHCATSTCSQNEFRCSSGRCIPGHWYCDGGTDCNDASDEPTTCTTMVRTCNSDQFRCDDGRCIASSWICDGDNDCGDMSDEDERHSCANRTCSSQEFTCINNRPPQRKCIPRDWVCDGDADCSDAYDEHQNCTRRSCSANEFTCNNGLCIRNSYRCDRRNDCGDSSDEQGCPYQPCQQHQFTCQNGRCVSRDFVCDGDNDCGDESDELDHMCRTPAPTCPPGNFRCDNGNCIPLSEVCDRNDDCNDNSDEKGCGINECTDPSMHHCDHNCTDTPTSFICTCRPGYRLMSDNKTCDDVDECSVTPSVCSQVCENTMGSYVCKCAPGFLREPDGRSCRQNSNIAPYLIFSNRYYLRNLSTDGEAYSLILQGLTSVVALDFDRVDKRLYWIDVSRRVLERMFFNGTGREVVVNGILHGEGLAVDWIGRKLYWVDSFLDCVKVSELDGRFVRKLAEHCVDANNTYCFENPRAIVLHPKFGYVYWTDWGDKAFIGRVGMDGNNKSAIITTKIEWPNGLTIDYTNDKLYWSDAHLNYIEFSDLDGNHRHTVYDGILSHPFAITVFEETVYWTDWNTRTVEKGNKYNGSGREALVNTTHRPFDIHVCHPYRQPIVTNPCAVNNGGCSHLCLLRAGGQGYTCECPDHFVTVQIGGVARCLPMCSSTQYRCADNERCIPIWWKCDGQRDCRDGSDEPSTCPVRHCRLGQFQCNDGNCTSPHFLCNSNQDCPDGSDEDAVLCATHQCESHQWQCANKRCISEAWQCDGENDCGDGSDENPAHCSSRTCRPGQFKCRNGRCIPQSWKCDVDDDCGDNSDEPIDECKELTCEPAGDFRCDNHQCIPLRWRCDGDNDCGDGSDEHNCTPRPCTESEYRCDNLHCIPDRWVCDHDNDCEDNSDERDCELRTCHPGYFQCGSGHCIAERFKCDGNADCLDFTDESSCPTRYPNSTYCPPFLFECKNHVCVQQHWICDGDNDCGDNSDEELHLCLDISCDPPFRFRCDNNRCIYSHELCNSIDDCGDGTDEKPEHCVTPTHGPCSADEYKCGNGQCIPLQYACDDYDDCEDQTDELGCYYGHGRTCSENLCEHNCTDLSTGGFICSCRPGYKPNPEDKNTCDDVNECEIYGMCPQLCKNSKGSYECFCAEGFRSVGEQPGVECAAEGNPPVLLLPDNVRIRRFNLSSTQYSDYVDNAEHIQALDYLWDPEGLGLSIVYWTVLGRGSDFGAIKRAYMTTFDDHGNNPVKEVDLNLRYISSPDGIAVDWIGGHIYWTDAGTNRIEVAKLDGRYRKWLIHNDLDQPAAIVVNPGLGKMFWTDWGRKPKIETAWMDGQHREVLLDEDLGWPTGLAFDYLNENRIYWCDSKENIIESMKADGTDRQIIISGDIGHPYSLDVFEGHVYWTTKEKGEVWKKDKFGKGDKVKVLTINPWLTQVRIYQQHRHNHSVLNPCQGVCSHLCLLRPGGYTCACPQGSTLLTFNKNECDAAIEAEVSMPLACRCMNGGTCYTDEGGLPKCKCPYGYSGSYCEMGKSRGAPAGTAVTVLLAVVIILITGALVVGLFLNYKRTGSLIPTMPKLPSLSSLVKSADTGNGVSFHSGDNVTMDLEPQTLGVSFIDRAMQLDENFADSGRQPITFENPLYSTAAGPSSDPAVIHATQVTVNVSGDQVENNFSNPTYSVHEQAVEVKSEPVEQTTTQESKWSFFKRKLKPSTTFENPTYSEMQDEQMRGATDDSSSSQPSPFVPPPKPQKREKLSAYSPTEDTFRDTANLVKEDSEI